MKQISLFSTLLLASNMAFAGFTGPSINMIDTVKAALSAKDDTYVELTGYITKSLGKEDYLFKDETGEIQIEIDNDVWLGQNITPNDRITIRGDVDSEWTKSTIDVDMLRKH
ncbi:YgiW/YdeI family stress tolerance OB fold protein [Vibrio sp. R78045]|uniref:YgiW/YdeI family stress tolerance OB fold protein n=1 Tax=Vibrio sp. R78045 TaxID=3093868 RepID=UPI0036F3F030